MRIVLLASVFLLATFVASLVKNIFTKIHLKANQTTEIIRRLNNGR